MVSLLTEIAYKPLRFDVGSAIAVWAGAGDHGFKKLLVEATQATLLHDFLLGLGKVGARRGEKNTVAE